MYLFTIYQLNFLLFFIIGFLSVQIIAMQELKQEKQVNNQENVSRHSEELGKTMLDTEYIKKVQQIHEIQQHIKEDHLIIKQTKKVYIGTGFTYDLTQFFKFERSKQVQPGGSLGSIFYEISGGGISWLLLIFSVVNASFICIWILSSKTSKFLVLLWRYLFQAAITIPFVLHERRTITFENSHKYSLHHIFKPINLKRAYFSSLATTLWYGLILSAGQWTYMSNALYLGSLTNFFLSIARHKGKHVHEYEIGGQVVIIVGIFFILIDTLYFRYDQIKPEQIEVKNNYYLYHTKYERLAADLVCILTSLMVSRFSFSNSGLHHVYPPYLCMLIIDIMNAGNMLFLAYFFNGLTFDATPQWGLFSLFTNYDFAFLMYGSIVLCIGLIISFVLIARLFPNFVAPSIAFFFEPAISTILLDFLKIQSLPRSFSLIGYTIMTPGMILILIGQWIFLRNIKKQQKDEKDKLIQLKQVTHFKQSELSLFSSERMDKKHSLQQKLI